MSRRNTGMDWRRLNTTAAWFICCVALLAMPAAALDEASASDSSTSGEAGSQPVDVKPSLFPPLQGKTEVIDIILEDHPLYKQAMGLIEHDEYGRAVAALKELQAQLSEEGHEPLLAECMYYEAGCHQMLNRMNAASDLYKKAFDLFAKYDSSNPLKARALGQYDALKKGPPLQGNVNHENVKLNLQRAQIAIDPNAVLEVRDNNRDVLLEVNDRSVLPKIVKECFSEMSCLETAEIGSNVTNADQRWMPLLVQGKTAAFAMNGGTAHPAFRAKVNGRSYLFDVILPNMAPGVRKILLVTNQEKICAVDVETFDTWLLRMTRASDGRILTARWYKLTHKKTPPAELPVSKMQQQHRHPAARRNW